MAATQPSAPPPLQQKALLHNEVVSAAAWPLYSPSASLATALAKRATVSLEQSTMLHTSAAPPQRQVPQADRSATGGEKLEAKNSNALKEERGEKEVEEDQGGKSRQQREKDEEEEDRGRRGGVVLLRENKLKAGSASLQLHSSRSPIPTRRKKTRLSALVGDDAASSSSASSHLARSTHINIHLSNQNNMATADELKQRQYEQFMAMAHMMKGDSFDTVDFDHTPPTSPRFLSLSTGSGLVAAKNQQHLKNGAPSPHNRSHNSSSSFLGMLKQRQRFLVGLILLCLASSAFLLAASYMMESSSRGGLFNRLSFSLRTGNVRLIQSPDQVDDSWFAELDRLRGRVNRQQQEEDDQRLNEVLADDQAYDFDVPVDESYKYRDYPFLLHNAVPRVAQNGTVIMVIANSGYLEFLLNWKAYVDQQNITNYIIIPVDVQMAQQLSYLGVDWAYDPEIGMDSTSQSVAFSFNKKSAAYAKWNKVVHKKSHYFKKILEMGYSVMVSDIDMVWLKNPFTQMTDKSVDLYFINDWDKPQNYRNPLICGGLFYGKQGKKSLAYINHVINCEEMKDKKEQYCMNMWFDALRGAPTKSWDNDIVITATERPNYSVLSATDFPSGAFYFGKDWRGRPQPFVVHNNWIVGKSPKLARFKEFGLWRVDETSLRNLMINFRYDEHRGRPERGREGEIADELMVYHTEMRKKFGRFEDGIWLLERPPVPQVPDTAVSTSNVVDKTQGQKETKTQQTTAAGKTTKAEAGPTRAGKAKVAPVKKVAPPKRTAARNPKYKYVDGNPNPHYGRG